jgi:hypothetical protein
MVADDDDYDYGTVGSSSATRNNKHVLNTQYKTVSLNTRNGCGRRWVCSEAPFCERVVD